MAKLKLIKLPVNLISVAPPSFSRSDCDKPAEHGFNLSQLVVHAWTR